MSTGMRKWMEKDCPETECLSAQVLIDREELKQLRAELDKYKTERDALRAKIEQMERQEPIAWTTKLALELGSSALGFDACRGNLWGEKGVPLYALPGAQPAPSVPEKITSVESGFKGMFLREAQAYKQGWNECRAAMIAAAPGGKP